MKAIRLVLPLLAISLLPLQLEAAPKDKKPNNNKSAQQNKNKEPVIREATAEDLEAMETIGIYFDRGYHIEESIKTLKPFATIDILKENKLLDKTLKLLELPTTSRDNRIAIFNFLNETTKVGVEEDDKVIEALIGAIKTIRSPMLSSHILTTLYTRKSTFNEKQLGAIVDVQNDILEDMISLETRQKFNHQDYIATLNDLKKCDDDKSKKLLIKALKSLTEKKIAQSLRIEILKTMAALTLVPMGKEPHFGLLENKELFYNVIALLKSANSTFQTPESILPEDISELEALLLLTENLMGDPNNTRGREDVFKELTQILKVNEPTLSKMAGQTFINAQIISFHNRLSPFKLTPLLLTNIKTRAMDIKQLTEMEAQLKAQVSDQENDPALSKNLSELTNMKKQANELNQTALELAADYTLVLISSGSSSHQPNMVQLLSELKDQFYQQENLASKSICLKAFSNLDLELVQSKYFPAAAIAVLQQMFENCFKVLETQLDNPQLQKVQADISKVLSEMTGAQIGPYAEQWRLWIKSPLGQRFFKRAN